MNKIAATIITANELSAMTSSALGVEWITGVDDEWDSLHYYMQDVRGDDQNYFLSEIATYISRKGVTRLYARKVLEYLVCSKILEPGNYLIDNTW